MTAHNIKTFKKRGPVVLCRLPLTLIVGNGGMNVHQWQRLFLCFFHNSYTPVNICRKTITQVVRNLLRQISARIKSLMAHKHTMTERAPREFFWRCKPAPAHIVAVIIHPVGVAIQHSRQRFSFAAALFNTCVGSNNIQRIGRREEVSGIEETHNRP